MSCLDVMYGAHYLPASYKAAYYHHHHQQQQQQQQQQRKLSVYSKMQECVEHQQQHCSGGGRQQGGLRPLRAPESLLLGSQSGGGRAGSSSSSSSGKDSSQQPAEAEYLNSRCVLFTYFQGDIGDVVDQHFSRALSTFGGVESKPFRANQPHASTTAAGLWKDGMSLSETQSSSLSASVWNGVYPSQTSPCLPSVSLSVHPDSPFSPSPVPSSFHGPDAGALWAAGHALSQASQASLPPDAWTYSLSPQGAAGGGGAYPPHVHDVYPHSRPRAHHVHARHAATTHHPMLHSYPAHGHGLDPRFSPLLLPGVRSQSQGQSQGQGQPGAPSPGGSRSSPHHSEGIKTEMDPGSSSPIGASSAAWPPTVPLNGPLEVYDSAVDQDKTKATAWF